MSLNACVWDLSVVWLHRCSKVGAPKHKPHLCSNGFQFGIPWQRMLMKCAPAHWGKSVLQIWITLQVRYFQMDVSRQIRSLDCEWRAENSEFCLRLTTDLKLLQQACNLVFMLMYATLLARRSASTWMHACCHNTVWQLFWGLAGLCWDDSSAL